MAKVLIADDDRLILSTLGSGISDAGHQVYTADCGRSAIEIALREQPEVALLDMRMPDISGLVVAETIRAEMALPVVFLSAYSDADLVSAAIEGGAISYLVKPLEIRQILPAIGAALERGAQMQRLNSQVRHLNIALDGERKISVAVGVLMERRGICEEEAFACLKSYARSSRRKMGEIAAELVEAASLVNAIAPQGPGDDSKRTH